MFLRFLRLTLYPPLIGAKNSFLRSKKNRRYAILSLLILLLIEFMLFRSGISLGKEEPKLIPALVFGMILSGGGVTFLASLIRSASNLFISTDAILFTIAPLSQWLHFLIRFFSIFFSASWSVLLFFIPIFLGISISCHSISFGYLFLFTIAVLSSGSAIAFSLIILLNSFFSASFLRDVGFISFFCLLVSASIFSLFFDSSSVNIDISKELLHKVQLTFPFIESLEVTSIGMAACSLLCLIVTKLVFQKFYFQALSKMSDHRGASVIFTKVVPALFLSKFPSLRAVTVKEYRSLFRDSLQLIQLLLFLGLTLLYLNFSRNIGKFADVPEKALPYWDMIKFIIHLIGSGLLLTGFSVRMIFPSFSLEGANIWILQSAPITELKFFLSKLFAWMLPLGTFGLILSISAMLSYDMSVELILVGAMSYLFSLLAVGCTTLSFGAHFSRFDWQHPGQLTGGWASLVCFIFAFSAYVFSVLIPITGAILFFISKTLSLTEFLLLTIAQGLVVGLFMFNVTKSTLTSIKAFSEARATKGKSARRGL